MTLQGKHSRTSGNVPNLVPGEFGINLADAILWLRGRGTKIALDLQGLLTRAPPAAGATGAAISQEDGALIWDADLSTSGVVAGVVDVDPAPAALGVPGAYLGETVSTVTLSANDITLDAIYVASDLVSLKSLQLNTTTTPTGPIRAGVIALDGTVLFDHLFLIPTLGANAFFPVHTIDLVRGGYYLVLWSGAGVTVTKVVGYQVEQGFDMDGSNTAIFPNSFNANQDMSAGLALPSPVTVTRTAAPGQDYRLFATW